METLVLRISTVDELILADLSFVMLRQLVGAEAGQ